MGKRKFSLGTSRKNEERKRWGFYPIRIPLNKVSVLNVSIPLDLFSFRVSLPISVVNQTLFPARGGVWVRLHQQRMHLTFGHSEMSYVVATFPMKPIQMETDAS